MSTFIYSTVTSTVDMYVCNATMHHYTTSIDHNTMQAGADLDRALEAMRLRAGDGVAWLSPTSIVTACGRGGGTSTVAPGGHAPPPQLPFTTAVARLAGALLARGVSGKTL